MSTNFFVVGGDLRTIKLTQMLENSGNTVYTYGLENTDTLISKNGYENIKNVDTVIGPIPFSKDGVNIYAPYSRNRIHINDLFDNIKNKTLIAGSISNQFYYTAKEININLIDIMKNEKLAILNCISTAEGAIEVAINNTQRIIHGSNVLILGFGRVSKVLAKKLQGLDVKVTCAARKEEAFAWIRAYGYNLININNLGKNLSKFDIIFNTVPNLILNEDNIKYIDPECLVIELASKPGGIDREATNKRNIKVVDALALPGKVAPITSAKFIYEAIYEILKIQ